MKKLNKISIASLSFSLDEDAYAALSDYMDILHNAYDRNPDGKEIIADIEARIAELILNEQSCSKVVSKTLIDTIIAQLGMPDSYSGDDYSAELSDERVEPSIPRRLYRSKDGAKVGGIFSGMSRFWNVDVVWFRLVFLIPFAAFLACAMCDCADWLANFAFAVSVVFLLLYILMWFAVPVAKTPRQKLEMRGERITASSIHQNFQSTAQSPVTRKAASVMAEVLYILGRVAIFVIKFFGAALGLAAGLSIAGLIAVSLSMFVIFGWGYISVVFALLTALLAIPQAVLCYVLLSFAFNWKISGKSILVSTLVWIVILIMNICISVLWIPRIATDMDTFEQRIERIFDASTIQDAIEVIKESAENANITIESSSVEGTDTVRTEVRILKIDDIENIEEKL